MKSSERLIWPDLLRGVSCFSVILIHITSVGINDYELSSPVYFLSALINSLLRWAVPVFFMISGMFLLDPDHEITEKKMRRKLTRLLLIIVVWGVFYSVLEDICNGGVNATSILKAILYVWKGVGGYHLWFLYTLFFFYLAIPVMRIVVRYATRKLLWGCVICWFLFSLCVIWLNNLAEIIPTLSIFSVEWKFEVLSGYVGYFILGYLLSKANVISKKLIFFALGILFALLIIADVIFMKVLHLSPQVVADPQGGLTCLLAIFIFLLCKDLKIKNEKLKGIINKVEENSMGIYLIHVFWIMLIFRLLDIDYILFGQFGFVIWFLIIMSFSFISTEMLKKIKILKSILML